MAAPYEALRNPESGSHGREWEQLPPDLRVVIAAFADVVHGSESPERAHDSGQFRRVIPQETFIADLMEAFPDESLREIARPGIKFLDIEAVRYQLVDQLALGPREERGLLVSQDLRRTQKQRYKSVVATMEMLAAANDANNSALVEDLLDKFCQLDWDDLGRKDTVVLRGMFPEEHIPGRPSSVNGSAMLLKIATVVGMQKLAGEVWQRQQYEAELAWRTKPADPQSTALL